jgi:pyruvate, orthophosphate dikinase
VRPGMGQKWVYSFNSENTEGDKSQKNLLGGKGANLAEMSGLKLPVPPGLTLTTEACLDYGRNSDEINSEIKEQTLKAIENIENLLGKKFGDNKRPLLFSVRSGARVSMPGMMDTVLNLGLNDESVEGLATLMNNPRFAWDSYRRFIQMYANVVMGFNISLLESTLEDLKEARDVTKDSDLSAEDLKELVRVYKQIILEEAGLSFPQDPYDQLWKAIGAVFSSWENPRAKKYREIHAIDHNWGTAVNIQAMVFGNRGEDSATGVCFTRDPGNGEKRFFGEYLINAQGEDVVAGIRTPAPINEESKNNNNKDLQTLKDFMPKAYDELVEYYHKLESHYKDMQDIEFTIESEKLYILQTRNGKRTAQAGIKIVVDFVKEGLLTEKEAVLRINPDDLNQLLHPRIDPGFNKIGIASGLPASPGAASGKLVFTSEKAHARRENGEKLLLVRVETSPDDISGMVAAEGILTARGGMTSHAAVVARGMGKPCVAGCSALKINESEETLTINGKVYKTGDYITIDGGTGEVIEGNVPTISAELSDEFSVFMKMADKFRTLKVRTNADNPEDSKTAIDFGAEGIGLCRTEHMFFAPERILAVQEMIFATSVEKRELALEKILPFQREDFHGIFQVMNGLPVNIRLLDPPLHEFLPDSDNEVEQLADYLGIDKEVVQHRGRELHEFNPMLGHRGCRLGITFPEIYRTQVRAIMEAACDVQSAGGDVRPEIMIPLVLSNKELKILRELINVEIQKVFEEKKTTVKHKIGTMIELPRAALTAGSVAEHADFFSFGTNDLTQTALGLSRDDSGKFLPDYVAQGIFEVDPFVSIDEEGVGRLISLANDEGKKTNPEMHIGICGEHGGDPKSIDFCQRVGLDYVSCSPFRVPLARLAAAQTAIHHS